MEELKKALIDFVLRISKDEDATDAELSAMVSIAKIFIRMEFSEYV